MDDRTAGARERRMIEDVDVGVLDTPDLSVADLFADAATTARPAGTVLGLFCQQAAALAALTKTEIRELEPRLAQEAAALALIDAAGALRYLADQSGDSATALCLAQLAAALEQGAGRVLYARSSQGGAAA
jgi:hypothetical protein